MNVPDTIWILVMIPHVYTHLRGFPGGSNGKESARKAGDPGSIPGSGRSPAEGNGNPLQDSCLGNPMDRGALRATVHGVDKSRTRHALYWVAPHTTAEGMFSSGITKAVKLPLTPELQPLPSQWSHTLSRHGIQLRHKDSDLTSQELQKEFQPFTKLPPPCLHQMPAKHYVIWLKSRDMLVVTLLKTSINKQDTTENSLPSFQTRRAILLFQRATLLITQTLS